MKISLVIPVYNEADSLSTCLDAVAGLTRPADEVIVVDNNSSDATRVIAGRYDFVTLINEPRQGVVHARTTGFDYASGDIIARIDGDSVLPGDWTENLLAVFADTSIDAASGQADYYGTAGASLINSIDLFFRRYLAKHLNDRNYLWGANMAIRREAWAAVEGSLCNRAGQHEDFDLAIHLQQLGGKVVFDERLIARVSSRRIDANFSDFMSYVLVSPNTYAQHGIRARRHMYPVVLTCALGYLPAYWLHKGYDPTSGKFSLSRLIATPGVLARVDPTAHVV